MRDGIVYTEPERCQACAACLQVCPVKAIKIIKGKAEVIDAACLQCGSCISVCSRGARHYQRGEENVKRLLQSGKQLALVLAPSYVIVARKKYQASAEQFCAAMRRLGFTYVYEASFAADVVTKMLIDYLKKEIEQRGIEDVHVITSPCPSLINYVEKHVPELIPELAPLLSPMAVQAVLIKQWHGDDLIVVGASPCIAKKSELLDEKLALFAESLTFEELMALIDERGINPAGLPPLPFDGVQPLLGAGFPISGGLAATIATFAPEPVINPVGKGVMIVEGEERSIEFLHRMAEYKKKYGHLRGYPLLIDILYCEGCVVGKGLGVEKDLVENKSIVAQYTLERIRSRQRGWGRWRRQSFSFARKNTARVPSFREWLALVSELARNSRLRRSWENRRYVRRQPSENELKRILAKDGKLQPEDELNCKACGYRSCRERAVAVYNGENEAGGCIVHRKQEAERMHRELEKVYQVLQENAEALAVVAGEIAQANQNNAALSTNLMQKVEAQEQLIANLNSRFTDISSTLTFIADIANGIADVARQTQLLSLNAQIEAARAGDLGRGFAVVASEVSKLAHDTGTKVRDVHKFKEQVDAIRQEIVSLLTTLLAVAREVGEMANNQAAVTEEMAAAAEELYAAAENLRRR